MSFYLSIFGKEMHPLSRSIDILITRIRKRLAELTNDFLILPSRNGSYRISRIDTPKENCA